MSLHSLKLNEVKDNSVSGNYARKTCCGQPISHVVEQQSLQNVPLCAAMGLGADNCQQLIVSLM